MDVNLDLGFNIFARVFEIVLVLGLMLFAAKSVNVFLNRYFNQLSRRLRIDKTQFVVLRRLIVFVVYALGLALAGSMIPGFANLGVSLLASAGILAVIIGFAAQHTFSNVISGVFIAIFEPFRVGDKVQIQDDYGIVEDITLRHTVIKTWQEKRIVIPNSRIGEESIINYSIRDPKMLGILEIPISYDSSIDKARKIMLGEAEKHQGVLKEVTTSDNEFLPKGVKYKVKLVELTDHAQMMRLYFWAPDKTKEMLICADLTESIKKRFDKEGIEVPYPYRTIVYKKDIK